jgi:L-glyceraldehyde 3-phosphate reductase
MAIQFSLKHRAVTSAIIGARNVAQLDDTLAALDAPKLSEATLKNIDSIAPTRQSRDAES